MPCAECGTPLLVLDKYEKLVCPNCLNVDYADPTDLAPKIDDVREVLTPDRIAEPIMKYSKTNILLYLMDHLQNKALDLYETRGMRVSSFIDLGYLIRFVYQQNGFGDEQLERSDELAKPVEEVYDMLIKLPRRLNDLQDHSRYALPKPVLSGMESTFIEKHVYFDSEYRYCWRRCTISLIGGEPTELETVDELSRTTRDFDRPEERETLEDFAASFYEFILGIAFASSNDDLADEIHGERLPDSFDVMDLRGVMRRLDDDLGEDAINYINEDGTLAALDKAKVDSIGAQIIDNWDEVREAIVVGEENPDAHPVFFEIAYEKPIKKPPGRDPITITIPSIVYARLYLHLKRIQLFPLMTRGGSLIGHETLKEVHDRRTREFERNVHKLIIEEGYESYHSARYTKSEEREIDIIHPRESEDEIWYIECKYFFPELGMGTADGIKDINKKFNEEIFPVDKESFPKKVEIWTETKPGDAFYSKELGDNGRSEVRYPEGWREYSTRMIVVSNLVPSYIEKKGVEFYTDNEFLELLNGNCRVYTQSCRVE